MYDLGNFPFKIAYETLVIVFLLLKLILFHVKTANSTNLRMSTHRGQGHLLYFFLAQFEGLPL